MTRIVLLNALPINAFPFEFFIMSIQKVGLKQIKQTIEYYTEDGVMPIVSNYIRHPATVKLLAEKLGLDLKPDAGLYQYAIGDHIFVITLNAPQRGQDVLQVSEQDISVYKIQISEVVR